MKCKLVLIVILAALLAILIILVAARMTAEHHHLTTAPTTLAEPEPTPEPVEKMAPEAIKPHPMVATLQIEVKPTPEPEPEPAYTDEELDLLALVIYQEAGADNCSDETRLRVGAVVLNRVEHPDFPDTIYDVVTEKRAYGELYWTGAVWPDRAGYESEAHAVARAYDIAKRVLEGERVLPTDVIFQSEYIMGEIVAQGDGMYFCR